MAREHFNASLIVKDAPLLLMVSGGADSTSLLLLSIEALQAGTIQPSSIHVLHINHCIRGKEADADERFVENLCADLGVKFHSRKIDVLAYAEENKLNLEQAGRDVRYREAMELICQLAQEDKAEEKDARIATAHTLNDRVETFYMRSIVGTGPSGLASITRSQGHIIRPLLSCTREEIEEYLDEIGQPYCTDSTNADVTHFRSFVRHEIVPRAKTFNPNLLRTAERSMDLMEEEVQFIKGFIDECVSRVSSHEFDRTVVIDCKKLKSYDKYIAKSALYEILSSVMPIEARIEKQHIEKIFQGMHEPGFSMSLPGDQHIYEEHGMLVLPSPYSLQHSSRILRIPSVIENAYLGNFDVSLCDASQVELGNGNYYLDASIGELELSYPKRGDRFELFGLKGGSKKLSDIFVDMKIPKRMRPYIPLLRVAETGQIAWLGTSGPAYFARVTSNTSQTIKITTSEKPNK